MIFSGQHYSRMGDLKTLGAAKSAMVRGLAVLALAVGPLAGCDGGTRKAPPDASDISSAAAPAAAAAAVADTARRGFDFYLLALTLHPAFCADGHARKPECRARVPRMLAIHGLWPERLDPGAYPRDCPAPALELDPGLAFELADYMPGMRDGLHEHEWRKHGGCSGLGDDEYFRSTLEHARTLDAALGARLTTLAGREAGAQELRDYADQFAPGLGATFTLHCRVLRNAPSALRQRPVLVEIRQCLDDDGPGGAPGTALSCAAVKRRDQGCGASFHVAEPR